MCLHFCIFHPNLKKINGNLLKDCSTRKILNFSSYYAKLIHWGCPQ